MRNLFIYYASKFYKVHNNPYQWHKLGGHTRDPQNNFEIAMIIFCKPWIFYSNYLLQNIYCIITLTNIILYHNHFCLNIESHLNSHYSTLCVTYDTAFKRATVVWVLKCIRSIIFIYNICIYVLIYFAVIYPMMFLIIIENVKLIYFF